MLHKFDITYYKIHGSFAGVDEAGRGCLAGPVCAAAVILPPDSGLEELGVRDSKKLSASKRERLYDEIKKTAVAVSVAFVDVNVIDEINILQASMQAMRNALLGLPNLPKLALIDGITLPHQIPGCAYEAVKGGDGISLSIAAASIVAKVTRDRFLMEYDALYPQYGFAAHKGYATKAHRAAIAEYGLSPLHRKSFNISSL
ncbi:MAG: ribonuclease HII [Defluviitaleaceae bacterium]|nr:ribonuclease HII [Defluviitaleaceae bacterium]